MFFFHYLPTKGAKVSKKTENNFFFSAFYSKMCCKA